MIQTSDGNGNGNAGVERDVTTPSSAGLSGESTLSPMTMTQSEVGGLSNANVNAHKSKSRRKVAFKDQEPSKSGLTSATQSSGSARGYDNVDVQPLDDLHEAAESTDLYHEDDDTDDLEQAFDDIYDDDDTENSAWYEKNYGKAY